MACSRPADSACRCRAGPRPSSRARRSRAGSASRSRGDRLALAVEERSSRGNSAPGFPPRPQVHRQGRPHPGPLRRQLAGRTPAPRRLRRLRRRETVDPGTQQRTHATLPAAPASRPESRARVRAAMARCATWPPGTPDARRCSTAAPRQGRDRRVRHADRPVHERPALPQGATRVRDRRQRLRAPRPALDRPPPGQLAGT